MWNGKVEWGGEHVAILFNSKAVCFRVALSWVKLLSGFDNKVHGNQNDQLDVMFSSQKNIHYIQSFRSKHPKLWSFYLTTHLVSYIGKSWGMVHIFLTIFFKNKTEVKPIIFRTMHPVLYNQNNIIGFWQFSKNIYATQQNPASSLVLKT